MFPSRNHRDRISRREELVDDDENDDGDDGKMARELSAGRSRPVPAAYSRHNGRSGGDRGEGAATFRWEIKTMRSVR